ncbi:EF-hand domain-containing protein [Sphingomonas sp. CROZ-RG-20F-R02-07]|uniref:EF-hand domain-containing protein n=1 Tax=Sphingomonas sp. CROZ-RG-20F-R02-07 TaxID=2914832 RepID=UPI001F57337B|nr:EF-hand domain-containing protein [Sphingomonas sp. CROZ-RG-20F-R02-07]
MLLILALAAQAVPAASPVRPQPAGTILVDPAAMFIAACDADGDARVTRAELDPCVARSFATADGAAGGSIGYIAYAEWAKRWLGDANALPSPFEVDTNGDDRITLAELQGRFAQIFQRLDVDRDGALTRTELVTIRASAPRLPDDAGGRKKRR